MHARRVPFLALGILSLFAGLWTGLLRLGWGLPALREDFGMIHGPLMVSGFLGTLIGLERAVGTEFRWAYAGPLLTGAGALALVVDVPLAIAQGLAIAGSAVLVIVFAVLILRHPFLPTIVMGLGALAWLAGNVLWLAEWPLYRGVYYWAAFLILTIAGERLELSRALAHSIRVRVAFWIALALFASGVMFEVRAAGVGMAAIALWLLRFDIARRTIRQPGLPRFIAVCLLSGYVWLAAGGGLAAGFGEIVSIQRYDAILHSLFLGFVMTMIFGHAPVIFPAVLGVPMAYRPAFYIHLVLLHLTLAVRVAGDLSDWLPGREWGGLLNVAAVLAFLANTIAAIAPWRRRSLSPPLHTLPR